MSSEKEERGEPSIPVTEDEPAGAIAGDEAVVKICMRAMAPGGTVAASSMLLSWLAEAFFDALL